MKRSLRYDAIPPDIDAAKPFSLRAVVESPRGSRHKYAFDTDIGAFVLRQTLASGLSWPYDYGFIPGTLGEDGDPLDVLVLMDDPTFAGCVLEIRILGGISLRKNGVLNDRFVGRLHRREEISLSTDPYMNIHDLPTKLLNEMTHFLECYSEEKGNLIQIEGAIDRETAWQRILRGVKRYQKEK